MIAAAERGGSLRDQTILIVMFHTGLRTMEVCDLAPGDIQIGKRSGQLTVRSGKRNKQREVPLIATCRAALEKYLAELPPDSSYLFPSEKTGDRLTERALRHLIQKTHASGASQRIKRSRSTAPVWVCDGRKHAVTPLGANYGTR